MTTQKPIPFPHQKYGMYYVEEDLRDAAYRGDLNRMQKLFEQYPKLDPNSPNEYNETALYIACKRGQTSVVEFLLKTPKIDTNATTIRGNSPMLACAWGDYTVLAKKLIDAGADTTQRTNLDREYHSGVSALEIAEERGNSELATLLKLHLNENHQAKPKP